MHVILFIKKKKANLFIYFQFFAPLFQKFEIVFLVLNRSFYSISFFFSYDSSSSTYINIHKKKNPVDNYYLRGNYLSGNYPRREKK